MRHLLNAWGRTVWGPMHCNWIPYRSRTGLAPAVEKSRSPCWISVPWRAWEIYTHQKSCTWPAFIPVNAVIESTGNSGNVFTRPWRMCCWKLLNTRGRPCRTARIGMLWTSPVVIRIYIAFTIVREIFAPVVSRLRFVVSCSANDRPFTVPIARPGERVER